MTKASGIQAFFYTLVLVAALSHFSIAQNKYRVYFKDKQTSFDPYSYFDQKAINRRIKIGINLLDSTDFPVNPNYLSTVLTLVDSARTPSRWLNNIAVFTSADKAAIIKTLPFVTYVEELKPFANPTKILLSKDFDSELTPRISKLLTVQINMFEGTEFAKKGLDGTGVRIAIFDAGFPTVNTSPVFKHIRDANHIIATYDFGRNNEFVYSYFSHGTNVMACIAGKLNCKNIGLAPEAEFLLARTENPGYEVYPEEENWLAAAEWADKNGADIINSSLGYTEDLYFKHQMDGRHSVIAKAATMAVKKGILVVNAAGNEGDGNWHIVASPGDADSVLTVGAISPYTGYHSNFSSYGPNKNKVLKPNICGPGTVATAGIYHMVETSGTSFASPMVAGFAACVLQQHKDWDNNRLFDELEKSASLYPYYDYAHGYGIPQANYFTDSLHAIPTPTFTVDLADSHLSVVLDSATFNAKQPEHERFLYYHIANIDGYLTKYYLIVAESTHPLTIDNLDSIVEPGDRIRIHYRGYTWESQPF